MTNAISIFLLMGIFAAGARLALEVWLFSATSTSGKPPLGNPPRGPEQIAKEGRRRAEKTDVSYRSHNRHVRDQQL